MIPWGDCQNNVRVSTHLVNHGALFLGVGPPQHEDHVFLVAADVLDYGVCELFPPLE